MSSSNTSQALCPTVERITIVSGPLSGLAFLRHTVDIEPAEGTVGFVEASGWRSPAKFMGGAWRKVTGGKLSRVATHWLIIDQDLRT